MSATCFSFFPCTTLREHQDDFFGVGDLNAAFMPKKSALDDKPPDPPNKKGKQPEGELQNGEKGTYLFLVGNPC